MVAMFAGALVAAYVRLWVGALLIGIGAAGMVAVPLVGGLS
jgi:hypothetical protein